MIAIPGSLSHFQLRSVLLGNKPLSGTQQIPDTADTATTRASGGD